MSTTIKISALRQDIYNVVKDVEEGRRKTVTITHGRLPVAMLVPIDFEDRVRRDASRETRDALETLASEGCA